MSADYPDIRQESLEVTRDLLIRYDRPGPRYTSYPTAPEWTADFTAAQYGEALARAAERAGESLSMYVHIPFCHRRCAFCGCNSIATEKEGVAERYLGYLEKEVNLLSGCLCGGRSVQQLHLGGGTPTYLTPEQLVGLRSAIGRAFEIHSDAEIGIEVDPRVTTEAHVSALRGAGFNRISMGVQDLDPVVQEEIGRNQTEEQTLDLLEACRGHGFAGINMDLIYGLPGQCIETWSRTLDRVVEMRPDRLAVYSYAYLPDRLHNQRRIDGSKVPVGPEKYELFAEARRRLVAGGYRAIGMDHFALPEDELTHAMDERRLHRNFMGYTVVPSRDMVALGISAIGEVGGCYAQNDKKLSGYYDAMDRGGFATACGCALTKDDEIRRWVIRRLMCDFHLDTDELRRMFAIEYDEYFAGEDAALNEFVAEGFIRRDGANLVVLPLGQVFVRNIAMVFDAYLKKSATEGRFSRTV